MPEFKPQEVPGGNGPVTFTPYLYVLDPKDQSDCEAFLKVITNGAKVAAASATSDRVVYLLLQAKS